MTKTGAMVQARGMLYKVVVQMVLLYRINSWVVTGAMMKVLEGFRHQAAWRIAVIMHRNIEDGEWEYPPVADSLEAAWILLIRE